MKCKTCGKEISKNAESCPFCGHSYKKKDSSGMSFISLLVITGIIFSIAIPKLDNTTTVPSATHIQQQKKIDTLPAKQQNRSDQKTDKQILEETIASLKEFDKFNSYNTLTMDMLNVRVQKMRSMGKTIFFAEDTSKKDKTLLPLWKEAKALQINVQKKHYPMMRDRLGPLMRDKMWEHNIEVKTIGVGYRRIVLSGGYFASNMNIKNTQESLGTMLSDYRFKRVDYKWYKDASEWTYFDLKNKDDNVL